jgi:hypothetical protein
MFRFTIRDVLWLMVVAGVGLGWWASYQKSKAEEQRLVDMLMTQEIDLQGFEHWILNPPDDDLRLVRLREWAIERRGERGSRHHARLSN